MDGFQFDALAKSVAAGASRRGVLKGLLGGALAAAASALGLEDAAAACRLIG